MSNIVGAISLGRLYFQSYDRKRQEVIDDLAWRYRSRPLGEYHPDLLQSVLPFFKLASEMKLDSYGLYPKIKDHLNNLKK